jgi:hypothetical protein
MKLSCYCCGEEIPDKEPFYLVSFGAHNDVSNRVMIFSEEHVDFADETNDRVYCIRPLAPPST